MRRVCRGGGGGQRVRPHAPYRGAGGPACWLCSKPPARSSWTPSLQCACAGPTFTYRVNASKEAEEAQGHLGHLNGLVVGPDVLQAQACVQAAWECVDGRWL